MEKEIRLATAQDLSHILNLTNHAILNTTANYAYEIWFPSDIEAWWEKKLAQNFPVYVAFSQGEFVGFSTYGQFREKEGYDKTREHSVYVWDIFHGKGFGKLLFKAIENHALNQQIHSLIGAIDADNSSSITFHEKLGFQIVGRIPEAAFKFNRWLDLVFVQKKL